MSQIIGLKQLRENMGAYEKRVQSGQSFIVMKRSKPIFTISPVEDEAWETVVDFTQLQKNGIRASELLSRLKAL